MFKRVVPVVIACIFVMLALAVPASARTTHATGPAAPATPKAYVLIDNDTGNVLQAGNERTPLPPASITKLLTALVVQERIPDGQMVGVGADAERMPAMRLGLKQGEVWNKSDLLHALLMVSANDAAVALADSAGETLQGFSQQRMDAARQLGLADSPVLNDPSGLDDTLFSNDGGDRISARDMAIVARAVLANDDLAAIVKTKRYEFTGPDGKHVLRNHNLMLDRYAGAIGMKTGYTHKARQTFVGAAKRDGRTMLAVVMGADNPYDYAMHLLDKGFATPVDAEPTSDHLTLRTLTVHPVLDQAPAPVERAKTSPPVDKILGGLFIGAFVTVGLWSRLRPLLFRLGLLPFSGRFSRI